MSSTKHKMRRNSFLEKYLKKLATTPAFVLLCPRAERLTTMILPFPADSAEFEEYTAVMEAMADEADKLPDPDPYLCGEYDPYEDYNWRDDR